MSRRSTASLALRRFTIRAEPSARTTANFSLLTGMAPGGGGTTMSAGFDHGTAVVASATRNVFEVPSGKSRGMTGLDCGVGNGVFGPVKTWYGVFEPN